MNETPLGLTFSTISLNFFLHFSQIYSWLLSIPYRLNHPKSTISATQSPQHSPTSQNSKKIIHPHPWQSKLKNKNRVKIFVQQKNRFIQIFENSSSYFYEKTNKKPEWRNLICLVSQDCRFLGWQLDLSWWGLEWMIDSVIWIVIRKANIWLE